MGKAIRSHPEAFKVLCRKRAKTDAREVIERLQMEETGWVSDGGFKGEQRASFGWLRQYIEDCGSKFEMINDYI